MIDCDAIGADPERVLLQDDFEQPNAVRPVPEQFSSDQAHSWEHSMKVGQGLEFGTLSSGTWADLGQHRQLRLRLWGWLRTPQQRTANLIIVSQRPNATPGATPEEKSRHEFNLYEVMRRYQQWVPASYTVQLPPDLLPTDEVAMYIWVPSGQPDAVYIDDFSIEYLD